LIVDIDLSVVPPVATLREADDFKEFKVVVACGEHAYVGVSDLKRLAGERGQDAAWLADLEKMIAYAQSQGWMRDDDAIRAHLEWKE